MPERLYLDHNATSPLRPQVREAMLEAMEGPLNPSSVHFEGRRAKAFLEGARTDLAQRLSVTREGIVFTSGGTEGDNLALWGLVQGEAKVRTLFISATEHDAMKMAAAALVAFGVTVETLPVTSDGLVDLEWFERRLDGYDPNTEGPFAVCVMLANNETGVIQPVTRLGPMVWPKGGYVVVDAVQAVGKIPVDFANLGADLMIIAGHKIGGPKGTGALLLKSGIPLAPLLRGGGQEQYRRAGTENIPGIVGLAKSIEIACPDEYSALGVIRNAMQDGLPDGVRIWGENTPRLPNTLCFSAPPFVSEAQVMLMDLAGISVSAGSACSSGKVKKATVHEAMGASEQEVGSALRVSLGWNTPEDAAERFLAAWTKEYGRFSQKGVGQ